MIDTTWLLQFQALARNDGGCLDALSPVLRRRLLAYASLLVEQLAPSAAVCRRCGGSEWLYALDDTNRRLCARCGDMTQEEVRNDH